MFASLLQLKRQSVPALILGATFFAVVVAILAALAINAWRLKAPRPEVSIPLLLCTYSLLFAFGASIGRQPWLGVAGAFQARYISGLVPAVIAIWWVVRGTSSSWGKLTKAAIPVLAILLIVLSVRSPELEFVERYCHAKKSWVIPT